MRAKKVFVMMVVVLSMMAVFAVSAHATEWYICTIQEAGAGGSGTTLVRLTDINGAFANTWFQASYSIRKEILAVALTAMTNNKKVRVGLSGSSQYSLIYCMYLIQ